ncbi:GNAT family N-acetyltransferase [Rhodovibrio salinarum]|nr:GNAT family N-acetyltransferase [Rhodovibrio salinarum]
MSFRRLPEGALALQDGQDLPDCPERLAEATAAALEALMTRDARAQSIPLDFGRFDAAQTRLFEKGVAMPDTDGGAVAHADMLLQRPEAWSPWRRDAGAYPFSPVMTNGRRHPQRPPKPTGRVYARYIPWLGQTLSFDVADPQQHLDRFHRWMNDPRVDAFFEEAGSLDYHRDYLRALTANPGMLPLIGCFDDAPFAYFEVYWAQESRLGPYYDADDYDRGWHVLVGEDAFRGKAYIAAWLPSLVHFMLLDDPRTQRIVGEPAANHHQQLRNLQRSGFAHVKSFDFPHKRAALVALTRERFFGDQLWQPADPQIAADPWFDTASVEEPRAKEGMV